MILKMKERWELLCEEIALEQDCKKSIALMKEVNSIFAARRAVMLCPEMTSRSSIALLDFKMSRV